MSTSPPRLPVGSPARSDALSLRLLLLAALAGPAWGQADYAEDFNGLGGFTVGQDGPSGLEQQGWIFKAQSGYQHTGSPTTDWVWREGPYNQIPCGFFTFAPQEGSGYLATDGNSTALFGGTLVVYDWAILPEIANLSAGDVMSFWARRELSWAGPQRLEVRYSPTGSTDTGSAPTDVGAFTEELLAIQSPPHNGWGQFSAVVPGPGRLAFRYVLDPLGSACHQIVGIDQLRVGAASAPCSGYPAIPAPGETVRWTAAGGPYVICAATEVPATATVIVEPGAEVFVEPGSALEVFGHLEVQGGARVDTPFDGSLLVHGSADFVGTAGAPVLLTGGPRSLVFNAPERVAAMPGATMTLEHVDLRTTVSALGDASVVARRVSASGDRNGFYVSGFGLFYGGNLAVRESSFSGGAELYALGGYVLVDDVLFDDSKLEVRRPWSGQTLALDGLVAVNRPSDTAFHLGGGDFWFGPDTTISGTQYPVLLEGGGLARGSVLPTTGNTVDRVRMLPSAEGRTHLSKTALPYEVLPTPASYTVAGQIVVDPGVELLMREGASFRAYYGSYYGTNLVLEGLPEAPILFHRADPGLAWEGVLFGADGQHRSRAEHVVLRGSVLGLTAEQTVLRVESCRFEGNDQGVNAFKEASLHARGSRWTGNGVGARSSAEGLQSGKLLLDAEGYPNAFEGNTIGLQTLNTVFLYDEARDAYWGAASGPADEDNPSGTGDPTPGTNHVLPFRATPPPANHAPVVRLLEHSTLFEEGRKLILTWEAFDDDAITGFQILYSPHGHNPGLSLYVDDIPASARSWEIVVPEAPPASNYGELSGLRVQAVDTLGQTGYKKRAVRIPHPGSYTGGFQPAALGGVQRPGQLFEVCGEWYGNANQGAGFESFLWFDGDHQLHPLGGAASGDCPGGFQHAMPPFSTDLARIVTVHTAGAGGLIVYGMSDYFEVRPPAALGDAPPTVALSSPVGGAPVSGGGVVPIAWSAADDLGLRAFDLHASYDDGRTWHTIAEQLAPSVDSFDWPLPPSTGIAAVRVRVVAHDSRFQNSSSTSPAFAILPGPDSVGTSYCVGAPNSVGAGARIAGSGSDAVADNGFALEATGLPPARFGIFYYGPTAAMLPFGDGFRCVGGATVRLNPAVQALPQGLAFRAVDLSLAPMAADFQPGTTWRFQFWYRDPAAGSAGFNLSDGLEVTWR